MSSRPTPNLRTSDWPVASAVAIALLLLLLIPIALLQRAQAAEARGA